MVDLFLDTMLGSYDARMIGSVSLGFSDLVKVGDHIESDLKSGRLQDASSSQSIESESVSSSQEEKEEFNAIWETHKSPEAPPPGPYYHHPREVVVKFHQRLLSGPQYQQPREGSPNQIT